MNKFFALTLLALSFNSFAMGGKPEVESPVVKESDKQVTESADITSKEITSAEASSVNLSQILPKYQWHLISAQNQEGEALKGVIVEGTPNIEMLFNDNSMIVRNTCNQLMAGYSVESTGSLLKVGQIAQTMRACIDPDMALKDDAMIALLSNLNTVSVEQVATQVTTDDTVTLVMTDNNSNVFRFNGVLTPEAYFGQAGQQMFLEISPDHVACELPVANSQCIQIREIVYDESFRQSVPDPTWIVYPNAIDGFMHEAGQRNIVRVKRFTHLSEQAQSNSLKPDPFYVLELVVESSIANPQ
ncbi:META domain-containing protein [Thorsellia anophelis]|uniref:Heat shock protein HslJ n=1 Tax=Thorsellia anophelis DSM 18579 TaxID=1123402 RepID=A0A1I0BAU6_9GAMM|nr:META domain-containing protein [Thorsellia anophelis]SET03663.1 Heat shock protein HslJ [Thorsellia anophelis DSM 18579]